MQVIEISENVYKEYTRKEPTQSFLNQNYPGLFLQSYINIHHDCITPLYEKNESITGFTGKQYREITGNNLPNCDYDNVIFQAEDGKVYYSEQAGNVSALVSGRAFAKKRYLLTEIFKKSDLFCLKAV